MFAQKRIRDSELFTRDVSALKKCFSISLTQLINKLWGLWMTCVNCFDLKVCDANRKVLPHFQKTISAVLRR